MPVRSTYTAVTLAGDLIAPELLDRVATGIELDGAKPADYGAIGRRSVADDAERAWDYLKAAWTDLRETIPASADPKDPTGAARRSWIEPLFGELGFGRLATTGGGIDSDDGSKTFPVSNQWTHVPIHITDWATGLEDRAQGQAAPHSLVQECLNTATGHLWGMTTNGRHLRLLRDSTAIAGTAYVEFDLETIFDNELVNEFVLLYRLLHVSRFEVADDAAPSACWLEKWRTNAIQAGMRALDQMKSGVQEAITVLGTGYLSHPENGHLIDHLDAEQFHRALLRLTYRLLFLFVIEDKGVLHAPDAEEKAKERYRKYYSTTRLRAHARRRRGTSHGDLYRGLRLVLDGLGSEGGQAKLALPGLGGIFDQTEADEILDGLAVSNEHLLRAVRALAVVRDKKTRRNRAIDYRHLDAEELGSVYESLLELVPKYSAMERRFELVALAGNQRKTTGSYYTPSNLIERLLDTTLDPVIDAAMKRGEERGGPDPAQAIEKELLSLTVCDPACGSGHFLVAAARRIAKKLAAVREQNPEPTPGALSAALREVVGRCIYGVDLNPMAVELAKVSLWLEAMEPGKALGFLDAHIKCGNSLIGAYPALMAKGIPDEAWNAIEGDDKAVARELKKRNKKERTERERGKESLAGLFELEAGASHSNSALAQSVRRILEAPSDDIREVRRKARAYKAHQESDEYQKERQLADTWCAAFFWEKVREDSQSLAPTDGTYWELERAGFDNLIGHAISRESAGIAEANRFFHWHLEFPEVFRTGPEVHDVEAVGWGGGFDAVIGNPPWEHVELKEQEFFATRAPEIAEASGAKRKMLIKDLVEANPDLLNEFVDRKRSIDGERHFLRASRRFPTTGLGRVNSYAVFAETSRSLTGPLGRTGSIVPTGIATDSTTQIFFRSLIETRSISALYDFENRAALFPDVDSRMKFCLLSTTGSALSEEAPRFAFFLNVPNELDDASRAFNLAPEEILMLNPNTGTCPVFRSRRDAEITLGIYRQLPVLVNHRVQNGNSWDIDFRQGLFNMTADSELFRSRLQLEEEGWTLEGNIFIRDDSKMLPLYEGRMGHQYNHRFSNSVGSEEIGVRELADPGFEVIPEYWVSSDAVERKRESRRWDCVSALLGHRRVTRNTDERTSIAALLPWGAASYGWILSAGKIHRSIKNSTSQESVVIDAERLTFLAASFNSFAYDYCLRNALSQPSIPIGVSEQIPIPGYFDNSRARAFITLRVIELSFTSFALRSFAKDLGVGEDPFIWDEERRFMMRAELDALFFHLYGIERDDVDYIMETFPIVKRKDEATFGSYRTKELILEIYDQMAEIGVSAENPPVDGENFISRLMPPPGQGPRHAPREA